MDTIETKQLLDKLIAIGQTSESSINGHYAYSEIQIGDNTNSPILALICRGKKAKILKDFMDSLFVEESAVKK